FVGRFVLIARNLTKIRGDFRRRRGSHRGDRSTRCGRWALLADWSRPVHLREQTYSFPNCALNPNTKRSMQLPTSRWLYCLLHATLLGCALGTVASISAQVAPASTPSD